MAMVIVLLAIVSVYLSEVVTKGASVRVCTVARHTEAIVPKNEVLLLVLL